MIQNEIIFTPIRIMPFVGYNLDVYHCGWTYKASAQLGAEVVMEVLKSINDNGG
jgi:hypothetical protein